jgi:hypothetical protein
MANSSPADIVVEYDDASDTPVDISQYVLTINDVDVEQILEETHAFGDAWEESKSVGIGRVPVIELGGLYDDTATTGPDALFADRIPETPATDPRTLTITWCTGKTTSVETRLLGYKRTADRGGLTKFSARLQPTGAVAEA